MALEGADPALLGDHDGDRLALHQRLGDGVDIHLGGLAEGGAALAERRLLGELLADIADLPGDRLPLHGLGAEQLLDALLFLGQFLMLLAQLDLLELGKRAQAHVEDRLDLHLGEVEPRDEGLLRLVGRADDVDDLVDVEIGDEQAGEDLEALVDGGKAMLRAADEHLAAVVEPLAQHLLEADDLRHLALHEHVHVERDAALELGELEQALHQQGRVDIARLRLEDEADVFGALVAHVGDERSFFSVDELGDLLRSAGPCDAIGESR